MNECYNIECPNFETSEIGNCITKGQFERSQCPDFIPCCESDVGISKTTTAKKRGHILQKAHEIINGERQDSYGSPEDSFKLIAEYWNVYLIKIQEKTLIAHGFDPADYTLVDIIGAKEVAEMMMLFKIARMSGQKPSVDCYTDLCGYAGIAADMVG